MEKYEKSKVVTYPVLIKDKTISDHENFNITFINIQETHYFIILEYQIVPPLNLGDQPNFLDRDKFLPLEKVCKKYLNECKKKKEGKGESYSLFSIDRTQILLEPKNGFPL